MKSRTTVLAMRSRTMDGIGALSWSWTYLERCEKRYEKSVTAGRIVRDELSGSHLRLLHLHRDMLDGFRDLHFDAMLAETLKNGVVRHAASSEENDVAVLAIDADDRALDAHLTHYFATVEDLNGPLVEIIVDVLRTGRRDVTELVRRWRGDWQLRDT